MFPYTLSDNGATVMIDGKPRLFSTVHPSYAGILEAIESGDEAEVRILVDVKAEVFNRSFGRVEILDNTILVAGKEVTGRLIDRILEMVSRGSKAVEGYVAFLDRLMDNPSKRAVDELYTFIEACNLPITPEGFFLAYKRVGDDYMDLHSNTIRNMVGDAPEMSRNEVDEDKDRLCSTGLHFCSYNYLSSYGNKTGNRVMVVEIDPANVVAIPSDYSNAKGRTWTYKVVGEIEDWEGERITPWFTDEYSDSDDGLDPDGGADEMFDEDAFDDLNVDIFHGNLKDIADEIHGDLDVIDMPSPDGIIATVSENGVSIIVEDGVDQEVVNEYMSDITGHVSRAIGESEIPEPIDTSTASDNTKRQKLTPDDVREIRRLTGGMMRDDLSYADIGDQFGVHRRTIEKIDQGLIWRHVSDTPEPIDTSTASDSTKRQKLSPNDVRTIRRLIDIRDDLSYADIGAMFNVHRRTIEKIDQGLIWSSIT